MQKKKKGEYTDSDLLIKQIICFFIKKLYNYIEFLSFFFLIGIQFLSMMY